MFGIILHPFVSLLRTGLLNTDRVKRCVRRQAGCDRTGADGDLEGAPGP